MEEKIIVKYENNEAIFDVATEQETKGGSGGVNGCVQGPPCPTCHWHSANSNCASGIYCRKPVGWACP